MLCTNKNYDYKNKNNKKEIIRKSIIDYSIKELIIDLNNILPFYCKNIKVDIERKTDMIVRLNGFSNFKKFIKKLNINDINADPSDNIYFIIIKSDEKIISYSTIEDNFTLKCTKINNLFSEFENINLLQIIISFIFSKNIFNNSYLITKSNYFKQINILKKLNFKYIEKNNKYTMNPFPNLVNPSEPWDYYNFIMDTDNNINLIYTVLKDSFKEKNNIVNYFLNTYLE